MRLASLPLSLTPTLAENMDPSGYVHRRSGDLLLVCVCQSFLASLLCDITTRAHVWSTLKYPQCFFVFVYSSPTIYSQALISHVRPLPYWIRYTQTSKRKFIFALVIGSVAKSGWASASLPPPPSSNSGTSPLPTSLFPPLLPPLTPLSQNKQNVFKKSPPSSPPCSPPPLLPSLHLDTKGAKKRPPILHMRSI